MAKYHRLYVSFTDAFWTIRRAKFFYEIELMHQDAKEVASAVHPKYSDEWFNHWYEALGVIVTSPSCRKPIKDWFERHGFTF